MPYLTLKYLNAWNDARYTETMQQFKKLLERIEESVHVDNDKALLQERIMKTSRICRHIEKYMDVLSAVEKTKAERGPYLKVPMRYEIWSILDSMMLAFGLYTEEELCQKYPGEFESEYVGVDKQYLHDLANHMREHWEKRVEFFTECRNRVKRHS